MKFGHENMILDDILKVLKRKSSCKAYTVQGQSFSYAKLYRFVCGLYAFLLRQNPNKRPVVVYGHKDVMMKAAFLACSFAGAAYVPIDESTPMTRVRQILDAVKPIVVLGDIQECFPAVSSEQCRKIMESSDNAEIEHIFLQPDDICYIIFTSGSTGTPKGVKVTYRNVDSCIRWLSGIVGTNREVVLNQADFSFDASVADLYLSVLSESEHYILSAGSYTDLGLLFHELRESGGSVAVFTPSFADLLLLDKSFDRSLLPELKLILFCGEKLSASTVKKLYERFGNIRVINCYGPTECTYAVTSCELSYEPDISKEIPLGYPKHDVRIYIVDEDLREVPDGQTGEIIITGASVADGYLNDPQNAAFMTYMGERAYATGDLGRKENGVLYFSSRKDRQIKYKGFRIELSDIEKNIYELGYVEKAVVLPEKFSDGRVLSLIAFLILRENTSKTPSEIARELRGRLPAYMCPVIRTVKELPLTENGKCDERKLLRSVRDVGKNHTNN